MEMEREMKNIRAQLQEKAGEIELLQQQIDENKKSEENLLLEVKIAANS